MLPQPLQDLIRAHVREKFPSKPFEAGVTPIPPSGKSFDDTEFLSMIEAVMDGWWTEGRFTQQFEMRFAKHLGRHFCITTNSGSSANLLALTALTSKKLGERRLKKGDEVITVAAGFPTTIMPIIQNGCVPVFLDIDLNTYNIDIGELEKALSPKTKAVMIAHTLGNPYPAREIADFCKTHNLWFIEDACDALGSIYDEKAVGTFGDISTFSFYPAHHITMGEGGALTTDNTVLNKVIRAFRDWGRDCWCAPGNDNTCGIRFEWKLGTLPKGYDHKYIYSEIGYNLKLTDTQAALGLAQLDKLESFGVARRRNHAKLRQGLKPHERFLRLPDPTPKSDPSWFGFLFSVRNDAPFTREELVKFLNARKIGTRNLFAGNMTRQPIFTEYDIPHRIVGDLVRSDDVMMNTLWIGCQPMLSEEALDYVIASIGEFCRPYHEGTARTNLSVVVPAYNEGRHLDAVIRRLHGVMKAAEPSFEIVLVNNGSKDDTGIVARALAQELPEVKVVDVYPNLGYGNGILRGLAMAQGKILGWIHADEQAKPEYLMTIYQRMRDQGHDIGRVVRVERDESWWRIFQSKIYNLLFRLMFNVSYRDINGSPKLMTRSVYDRAALQSREWFIDPELMIKANDMKANITELDIVWEARKGGKSKVHLGTMFHFLKHMFRYRYRRDLP